eukprot:NODE_319_length_11107_cov_0.311228.p2 type:complete len:853 gc:universal NODE_319_length_11107_cov_0.311228:2993-435(-)
MITFLSLLWATDCNSINFGFAELQSWTMLSGIWDCAHEVVGAVGYLESGIQNAIRAKSYETKIVRPANVRGSKYIHDFRTFLVCDAKRFHRKIPFNIELIKSSEWLYLMTIISFEYCDLKRIIISKVTEDDIARYIGANSINSLSLLPYNLEPLFNLNFFLQLYRHLNFNSDVIKMIISKTLNSNAYGIYKDLYIIALAKGDNTACETIRTNYNNPFIVWHAVHKLVQGNGRENVALYKDLISISTSSVRGKINQIQTALFDAITKNLNNNQKDVISSDQRKALKKILDGEFGNPVFFAVKKINYEDYDNLFKDAYSNDDASGMVTIANLYKENAQTLAIKLSHESDPKKSVYCARMLFIAMHGSDETGTYSDLQLSLLSTIYDNSNKMVNSGLENLITYLGRSQFKGLSDLFVEPARSNDQERMKILYDLKYSPSEAANVLEHVAAYLANNHITKTTREWCKAVATRIVESPSFKIPFRSFIKSCIIAASSKESDELSIYSDVANVLRSPDSEDSTKLVKQHYLIDETHGAWKYGLFTDLYIETDSRDDIESLVVIDSLHGSPNIIKTCILQLVNKSTTKKQSVVCKEMIRLRIEDLEMRYLSQPYLSMLNSLNKALQSDSIDVVQLLTILPSFLGKRDFGIYTDLFKAFCKDGKRDDVLLLAHLYESSLMYRRALGQVALDILVTLPEHSSFYGDIVACYVLDLIEDFKLNDELRDVYLKLQDNQIYLRIVGIISSKFGEYSQLFVEAARVYDDTRIKMLYNLRFNTNVNWLEYSTKYVVLPAVQHLASPTVDSKSHWYVQLLKILLPDVAMLSERKQWIIELLALFKNNKNSLEVNNGSYLNILRLMHQ